MSEQEESNRIVITEEDVAPLVPEAPESGGKTAVSAAGRKVGEAGAALGAAAGTAVKKAWQSEPRQKATRGLAKGAAAVGRKSSQFASDVVAKQAQRSASAMQERVQETDWKEEARGGTVKGLRWLSQKLSDLAGRFAASDEKAPDP